MEADRGLILAAGEGNKRPAWKARGPNTTIVAVMLKLHYSSVIQPLLVGSGAGGAERMPDDVARLRLEQEAWK